MESESVLLILFFAIFGLFIFYGKKHLYAHEHEESIEKELNQFDKNLDKIDKLEKKSHYKQSGHLYE